MGDWNAIVGEGSDGQKVGVFRLRTGNGRGDRLLDFYVT